jgi:cytochrome c oxidase assembly protein subunit 15
MDRSSTISPNGRARRDAPTNHTRLRGLAIASVATTFLLIAVGGLVRATNSGLGCSGWPKCTPQRWLPPLEYHAIIEYSHRLTAFIDIVLIGVLAAIAWRGYRGSPRIVRPAMAAVGLVFVQAALGGIVVRGDLAALLVTAHFATAMVLVGVLVFAVVASFSLDARLDHPADGLAQLATFTSALTFALVGVGAYVRGEKAGLVFPTWPLMNGRLLPDLPTTPAAVHFAHRVLALAVGVLISLLAARAWRHRRAKPATATLALLALALFVAQVLVGAANVWSRLAAPAVVAHVALAALTWGALVSTTATARIAGGSSPAGARAAAMAARGP